MGAKRSDNGSSPLGICAPCQSAHHHRHHALFPNPPSVRSVLCLRSIFLRAEREREARGGKERNRLPRRHGAPSLAERVRFTAWSAEHSISDGDRRGEAGGGSKCETRGRSNADQLPKGRFIGLFCIWRENNPEAEGGSEEGRRRRSLSLPILAWYVLCGTPSQTARENSGREVDGKMTSNYPIVSYFLTLG